MKIVYTSHFKKSFKNVSLNQKNLFFERIIFLQEDVFHQYLKTH